MLKMLKFPTIYSFLFMRKGREVLKHTPLSLSKLSHYETLNVKNITNFNKHNSICYTECFCMIDERNKKQYKGIFMWKDYTSNIIITPITIYPLRKKYYELIYFNPCGIDGSSEISQYHAYIDNYRVKNINSLSLMSLNDMKYIQQDFTCFRL